MRITELQKIEINQDLKQAELDYENARRGLEAFRLTSKAHSGDDDYALDTTFITDYANASARINELEAAKANGEIVTPVGDTVQIGSYVEIGTLTRGVTGFFVVEETLTTKPIKKECSVKAPLVSAILGHKVGDVCEFEVNGKKDAVAIGLVDNDYGIDLAAELTQGSKQNIR